MGRAGHPHHRARPEGGLRRRPPLLRIITTFSNPYLIVRHDTGAGGAVHPETGERIVGLGEFLRRLHAQRAVHQATGTPYAIWQEIAFHERPEQGEAASPAA